MEDIKQMVDRLSKKNRNPERFLMFGDVGIKWTSKHQIQDMVSKLVTVAELYWKEINKNEEETKEAKENNGTNN